MFVKVTTNENMSRSRIQPTFSKRDDTSRVTPTFGSHPDCISRVHVDATANLFKSPAVFDPVTIGP